MQNITTTRERAELRGMEKFANYSVQVLAYTQAGDGARSNVLCIQTKEDGECPLRAGPCVALPHLGRRAGASTTLPVPHSLWGGSEAWGPALGEHSSPEGAGSAPGLVPKPNPCSAGPEAG